MNIDLYSEIKKAVKDALKELQEENQACALSEPEKPSGVVLLTIKQFCSKHPFISPGSLYALTSNYEYNKFDSCIARAGRKILIKEKEALEYFSNPPKEFNWTYDHEKYRSR